MTRGVRPSIPQLQRLQCLAPPDLRALQILNRLPGVQKENVIVIDFPGSREASAKTKLPSQNGKRTGAQLNASIIAGLGHAPIHSRDSRFVDTDQPIHEIKVREDEGNLLGRS